MSLRLPYYFVCLFVLLFTMISSWQSALRAQSQTPTPIPTQAELPTDEPCEETEAWLEETLETIEGQNYTIDNLKDENRVLKSYLTKKEQRQVRLLVKAEQTKTKRKK